MSVEAQYKSVESVDNLYFGSTQLSQSSSNIPLEIKPSCVDLDVPM